jgi:hypothetical protein
MLLQRATEEEATLTTTGARRAVGASLGPSDLARAEQVWSRYSLSGGDEIVIGAGVEGVGIRLT